MVEGRLQREEQVVDVIVSKCFAFIKMLGRLLQRADDDLPVLTLSGANEISAPYPSQNKRTQVGEEATKEAFHRGRNFKQVCLFMLQFTTINCHNSIFNLTTLVQIS
jgi:error-prone DNA polymerase